MIKSKNGDSNAFTQLMLEIKTDLYKIAKTRLSNEEDIKDALQETMITAFKYIKNVKEPSKFKHWIIKILINQCNKIYKKKKKYNYIYENIDFSETNEFKYLSLTNNNTDIVIDTINFFEMINCLDNDEQTILILYYNEKYSTKEISKLLHIKENTIKSKIFRAKEKIKTKYKGGLLNG